MKINNLKLCSLLIISAFLSGCLNGIATPSSIKSTNTQVIAENSANPTPAATLPELIIGLSNDDPVVRIVSTDALEKYGDEAALAVPQLRVNLYYDGSSEVRRSAVIALGKLGNLAKVVVPDLISVIEKDAYPSVVFPAVKAIGEIGDASVVPHLASTLYCENKFYEGRYYSKESCQELAIVSAEAIGILTNEHFIDAGTGGYTLNDEGIPLIVLDARKWWDEVGQFMDWSGK